MSTARHVHFRGLDSLRFLAALFVIIGHIPMNQASVGLPNPHAGAAFYRGAPAVAFFFSLSGFLITYLLLEERRRTGAIDVGRFYLRRACRIWPLYLLIVGFGLVFYNALLPAIGIEYRVEYPLPLALLLYTLLLPNLMNSLYTVGGILNPLWSIGVEEQFYLAWAPAVRRWLPRLVALCGVILAAFLLVFILNHFALLGAGRPEMFFGQLKFHFMAAGGLCAVLLHRDRERFLALPPFASRLVQALLFALLLEYYILGRLSWGWLGEELLQLVLYPWLIVTVAANPRNLVPVANRPFEALGTISYGLYLFHMPAVYLTSAVFRASSWWRGESLWLYAAAYYGMALGVTILAAHLSYRWLERPFLRLKDRRWAAAAPAAHSSDVVTPRVAAVEVR